VNPPVSKRTLWTTVSLAALVFAVVFYWSRPVAVVERVKRGTAISAIYGTVRIEPSFVNHVRAQNAGLIRLGEPLVAGRGAIGTEVKRGDLLATIADETTARQLKQARADLQAAIESAQLELPSAEPLKIAESNVERQKKLATLSNVPAAEYEKAKSEANRLRAALKTEQIERDRNIEALRTAAQKVEAQMQNSEIRAPMDGILSDIKAIEGEFVSEGSELLTISSRRNYVRGEVNEEDVGEAKVGMKAILQMYAYRNRQFNATVTSIVPSADPETQRYTVLLDLENPPENLLAGMTGEMNIITGQHAKAILVPTRALVVDQVWQVKHSVVEKRTIKVGYRTLEFSEVLDGLQEGDRVVVSDQDKLRSEQFVRERTARRMRQEKPE
jgi:RND family efflux transporter MFP subunit